MSGDVSFIVPAFNAATTLRASVSSIRAAAPGAELVIVDDGSLDDTRQLAGELADVMVCRPCQAGAARARNDGCKRAHGRIFFFVDADVTVSRESVGGLLAHLTDGADAAFGAYTPLAPDAVRNAATDYKNLLHHFTHLEGATSRARTFWSGFGAITRDAFDAVGGFDPAVTRSADVEDIHLGYRLHAAGYRIVLDPRWQVQHHKRYTPRGLARSDLFHRAIPWTRAMVELRPAGLDLALKHHSIASSSALWLALASLAGASFAPLALTIGAPAAAAWLWWNRRIVFYAAHRLGLVGALQCAGFLAAFHLYAPVGAGMGLGFAILRRPNRSIRNTLSLDLLGSRPPSALEVSVAVIEDPAGGLAALGHLPEPATWWELVVVATEEPSSLPPGASFRRAPAGTRPNGLRQLALETARGPTVALLDGSNVPSSGWLERVRAAAERGDLVVGGAFEHDRSSAIRRASFLTYLWMWRPERPPAWIGDHPPTNAVYDVAATRFAGGFTTRGALLWRLSGFGALVVRFDPSMRVALDASAPVMPLRRLHHIGRLRAAALVRYYDNGFPLRVARAGWTALGAFVQPFRIAGAAVREGTADRTFWAALPIAAVGLAWRRGGEAIGFVLPAGRGGDVRPPMPDGSWFIPAEAHDT